MRWGRLRRLGPWWTMAFGAAAGVGLAAAGLIKTGGYLVALSLALGALMRLVMPREAAGGLAVRRRWIDVVSLGGLAVLVATAFALVWLDPGPPA
ncbi:MAG: DUF3017 domain-containing protein [Dermatophilaceae bacterium]